MPLGLVANPVLGCAQVEYAHERVLPAGQVAVEEPPEGISIENSVPFESAGQKVRPEPALVPAVDRSGVVHEHNGVRTPERHKPHLRRDRREHVGRKWEQDA